MIEKLYSFSFILNIRIYFEEYINFILTNTPVRIKMNAQYEQVFDNRKFFICYKGDINDKYKMFIFNRGIL